MPQNKKEHPKEKTKMHARNKHRERYDFKQLIKSCPDLARFVRLNEYKDESIDFSDPKAVKTLNQALLKHYYDINFWNIPENYLCPPIPGRADYIHYIADLLAEGNNGEIPTGKKIKCLDVGVGANCVYPIIGNKEYGWSFVGCDVDPKAIASAEKIIDQNPAIRGKVKLRLQQNPIDIFYGIIKRGERIDITICNPPFHSSAKEAQAGSIRKQQNLSKKKVTEPVLNFGGQSNELYYKGGEVKFVQNMIRQSNWFSDSCMWFTTLISKQSNLKIAYKALDKVEAVQVKTIPMGQGNKASRILAWSFLTPEECEEWMSNKLDEKK